jgi:hypothetical protein
MRGLDRLHRVVGVLAALVALAGAARPAEAVPPQRLGGEFRYWRADGDSDLRDYIVWWSRRWFHLQYEYWDFVADDSHDHARPEVGVHIPDRRKSVYTLQWRREYRRDRWTLSTDQVLAEHWVGRAEVSPIVWPDSTQTVVSVGADYYWGSYNFASATLVHDPREDNLWIVPMRVRLANEEDDWIQLTLSPASRHSLGWAVDLKVTGCRIGIERNSRYDFTSVDNVILTVGYERSFHHLVR